MLPAAQRELRLCEVMCRYLEQCEAIRDREHDILPPLTPEDLDSKADRFTGVLDPKVEGGSGGSRRRRQEDSGSHSSSQDRVTLSAGANAIVSARMALSIMGPTRSSGGAGRSEGDEGGGDVRREEERGQHHQQSVAAAAAAGSSIAGRAKGLTARIAAAQRHALDERATRSGSNSNNTATTITASTGTGEEAAAGGRTAAARGGSMPAHFRGRSLMSAEWSSKPEKGAAGRRGHPRYPTKGMTPESWTATGKDKDTPTPVADGDLPPPSATAAGVGEKGTAKKEPGGRGDGCLRLGSGAAGDLSIRRGHGGRRRGRGGGARLGRAEGIRENKRGLGRDWKGLYQVRPFDNTPGRILLD
ncbi:unnamed protein product [Ectocarpus sp. 12 AP-2014]